MEMIEAKVRMVGLDQARRPVVILDCGDRVLPIWVGSFEAAAISAVLSSSEAPRPMTHDTTINVIRAFSSNIERVVINRLENSTFFAQLYLKRHDQETDHIRVVEIDCRPSDAIALALRQQAPILVSQSVLDSAGVDSINVDRAEEDEDRGDDPKSE